MDKAVSSNTSKHQRIGNTWHPAFPPTWPWGFYFLREIDPSAQKWTDFLSQMQMLTLRSCCGWNNQNNPNWVYLNGDGFGFFFAVCKCVSNCFSFNKKMPGCIQKYRARLETVHLVMWIFLGRGNPAFKSFPQELIRFGCLLAPPPPPLSQRRL